MTSLIDELFAWMKMHEGVHLEFKEAKNGFETEQIDTNIAVRLQMKVAAT